MRDLLDIVKKMKDIELNENESLIKDFILAFEENSESIIGILEKENSIFNANYQYSKMLKLFDKIKHYKYDELKKYISIGRVVCVSNGDCYFVLELILKALLTKTKIVFATEQYMLSVNTYIVELLKKVLEHNNISSDAVAIYGMKSYKDVIRVADNIDCIVINKDYDAYKVIEELTNIKVIYSDYGNINVYCDSKDFDAKIKEICLDAKKESKAIFLSESNDIEKYLEDMNNNFVFHSVVVLTKNLEQCKYFFKNIKAENVYINVNPFEYIDVEFSEFNLLYQKKIVI